MIFKIAFRNIFRQKRRTVLTTLSMLSGFVLSAFFIGFSDGSYSNIINLFTKNKTGHIQIHQKDYLDNPSIYKSINNPKLVFQQLEKLNEIDEKQVEIDSWQKTITKLQKKIEKEKEITIIQKDVVKKQAEITEKQKEITEKQKEIVKAKEISEKQEEIEKAQTEIEKAQTEIEKAQTEIVDAQKKVSEKQNGIKAANEIAEDVTNFGKAFQKISSYGVFMANMVDAKSPDDVKNVIETAAMPVGGSSVKKYAAFNIAVASYLGASFNLC